jgi:RNA polymerase sigma-70 factor (ECF subfamily)
VNSDFAATATLPQDSELIRRAKQGDSDAFATLFKTHKTRIYSLCLRMTNNSAEAEDLAQDAFLQVFRKLGTFRGDSALSTWLYRIAVNTVLMHFRKKSPNQISLDEPYTNHNEDAKQVTREYGTKDDRLTGCANRLALTRAISELPQGCRTIFLMHEVDGYEHREIAKLLGCSVGNSKSQLHKAKLRVREFLAAPVEPRAEVVQTQAARSERPKARRVKAQPVRVSARVPGRVVENWKMPMPPAAGIDSVSVFAPSNA